MHPGIGIALLAAAASTALLDAVAVRRAVAAPLWLSVGLAAGVLAGVGALLLQDRVTTADWIVTVAILGTLTPVHLRLVFGRPGPGAHG